ncbi:MAG TPA: DoxX family protein [Lacunisphaera sp.]
MQKLRQFIGWADTQPKVWLDCVRIYLGLGLFIRGLFIITNTRADFVQTLIQNMAHPWLVTVGLLHYVTIAHLIGGLTLMFGLLTRIAAWVQIPVLAGAILMHRNEDLMTSGQSLELSTLVLFLLVTFAFAGADLLSVDNGMPKLRTTEEFRPRTTTTPRACRAFFEMEGPLNSRRVA